MRVGLVVPEFPPDTIGGGGVVFEGLALALHARGHDVRVLTSSTAGGPKNNDPAYPFPILRVPQFKHFSSQFRTYMPPLPLPLLAARRFLRDCDVYHLHGYGVAFVDAVFNVLVDASRSVFTSHGFPYTAPRSGIALRTAYRTYDALFGKNVLRKACKLTAVSSMAADEITSVIERKVDVIPNGFQTLEPADAPGREIQALIGAGRYILCVGRIEPLKGFDLAITALAELRAGGNDLRLIVAGPDNSQQAELVALAGRLNVAEAVTFPGRLSREALAHLYRSAAYCVVSSLTESFSIVTLEAMSHGAPCILSAVGGMLDIGRDGENALFFPPGDAAGIVKAVRWLENDAPLRGILRANGYSTLNRFSWPEIAGRYERLYALCV